MRVVLTKDYKVHEPTISKKGTEFHFGTNKAKELIELGVAEPLNKDLTKEEIDTIGAVVGRMEEEGELAPDTPISEVKKVTPKGKG